MNRYLLLTLIALAAISAACGAPVAPAPAPTPDPVALVRQYLDADNRGDIAGALAYLSDDAVIRGLGSCMPSPCVGKDAIRTEIERGEAAHTLHTRVDAQANGNTVTARIEHQNDASRAAKIDRFVVLATVELQSGKIASIQRKLDASDSQTAAFIKFQQAQAPN